MSKLKQMQLEIAHLISSTTDQEALVDLFVGVRTGGASSLAREKTVRTIIDLNSIYGKSLDEAVSILLNLEQNDKVSQCGEQA